MRDANGEVRARQTPSATRRDALRRIASRSLSLVRNTPPPTRMASSSVHLAIAAAAGIALGAGAALSLRPAHDKPNNSGALPPPPPPGRPTGLAGPRKKADEPLFPLPSGPDRQYHGPVTGAQVVGRELDRLGSVGQSRAAKAGLPWRTDARVGAELIRS